MDRIIELDGKDYLICQELVVDGKEYIYAASVDEDKCALLVRSVLNGEVFVESVSNDEEFKKVMSIIADKNI